MSTSLSTRELTGEEYQGYDVYRIRETEISTDVGLSSPMLPHEIQNRIEALQSDTSVYIIRVVRGWVYYIYLVEPTGTGTSTGPDISVSLPSTALPDGASLTLVDGEDLGSPYVMEVRVTNAGTAPLTFTASTISAETACTAAVLDDATSLAAGASCTLRIEVERAADDAGAFSFTITINSNDTDTPAYDVDVSGNWVAVEGELPVAFPWVPFI